VRRRQPGLTAQRLTRAESLTLADGRTVDARPGDVRISRESLTLDLLPEARFQKEYEPIVSGALTLTPAECARLEQTTGVGSTQVATSFVSAVERLASIAIGDIHLDFTPGQLEELRHRAAKRGQTIEQTIKAVVDRIRDEIFHHGG